MAGNRSGINIASTNSVQFGGDVLVWTNKEKQRLFQHYVSWQE
jgi:hypothetical protein